MVARALPSGPVVADASFLIALALRESPAARLIPVLRRSVVTTVNFGEVLYNLEAKARLTARASEAVFTNLGVVIEPLPLAAARHFPMLKQLDSRLRAGQAEGAAGSARRRALSLADLACLGHARHRELPVLTGDRHWLELDADALGVAVFDFRDPDLTI